MNVLHRLTWRHVRMNPRRTLITVVGILLSVAMVTAISGMIVSFQDFLYQHSVAAEGLWHVRYSGLDDATIAAVVGEPMFTDDYALIPTEDGPLLSLLFAKLDKSIFDRSEAVCEQYGIGADQVRYHNELLMAKGIVPGAYYRALYSFAGILLSLVGAGSVLVIANAFAISADARSHQFGLLRSTGATGRQIRSMVRTEGVLLTLIAIPAGLLTGLFAQWVALSIANRILKGMASVNMLADFRVVVSPLSLLAAVVMAFVTVLAAAHLPAKRAAQISAVEAIRQTRTVKLADRPVHIPAAVGRLFGFEGLLAAKTMARNRAKYRATVAALAVSIVLFLGVSSFGDILIKATSLFYEDMGSNVLITLRGAAADTQDDLTDTMAGWEGTELFRARRLFGDVSLPDSARTGDYQAFFAEETPMLRLYGIGDEAFFKLCETLRIEVGDLEGDRFGGILVNTTGTIIRQGRRAQLVPFRLSSGDRVAVSVDDRDMELQVAGVITHIPTDIYMLFDGADCNVIVPDSVIRQLWYEENDRLTLSVLAADSAAFTASAEAFLGQNLSENTFQVTDYDAIAASNRNLSTLVMIFVYGFIAMLTLIGITSVVATVSTHIALRTREFAMLRSVGMTEGSLGRMLSFESLLYGVRSLLWGIPLGLVACLLLYRAMTSVMDFPFIWPVGSIAICIVAILLITFVTMAFARRKQRQIGLMDALRGDMY